MRTISRWILSLSLVLVPAGAFAAASAVADVLHIEGNRPVTRAEFLKAAVVVLKVPVQFDADFAAYAEFPEEIRPYLAAADLRRAFQIYSNNRDLSTPIPRGEALRLISTLHLWKGSGTVLPFRDVEAGTELETAVRLSVQYSWAKPLRQRVFGVNAILRGKEARAILTRAATDASQRDEPTVTSTRKKPDPIGFASKKFRDQVQNLLKNEYLYADTLKTATGATAQAFVESIKDPYTTLFDPVEAKAFKDQLSGTVTGIGVHLDDEHIEIISVIEGSPAARAGLKPGDRIVSVNKKRIEGMALESIIKRIRGREGSPVRIGVVREGKDFSFDMIRAQIDIPDTKLEYRNNVAILTISQFGDHLIHDAPKLFDDIAQADPDGIVIDLRFNPGGYLQAVPSVVGELLPKGSVYLYTRGRTFQDEYVTDTDPSIPADIPVVLLANGNSASSAEIVAGALQDHERATIIGEKTFGKGTVQTVYPFANKSNLKFTIAEWLTPDEHPINEVGVSPDVEIKQSDAGDAQLDAALDFIRLHPR